MSFGHGHYWHACYCWTEKKVLQSHNIGTARIATHIRTINAIHTSNKQHPLEIIMPMVRVCNVRKIMNSSVCNLCDQKFPCGLTKKRKKYFGFECVVFGWEIWILIVTVCCAQIKYTNTMQFNTVHEIITRYLIH